MLKIVQRNNPILLFPVSLLVILLYIDAGNAGVLHYNVTQADAPLSRAVIMFFNNSSWKYTALSVAFIITIAEIFYLTYLDFRFRISSEPNFSAPLLFIFIISVFRETLVLSPYLISLLFFTLFLNKILNILTDENYNLYNFFDAGFYLGLATLFYTDIIVLYTILIYITLRETKKILKETVLSLLGLITPFLFFFSISYLTDIQLKPLINFYSDFLNTTTTRTVEISLYAKIYISYIFILSFISFIVFRQKYFSLGLNRRTIYSIFILIIPELFVIFSLRNYDYYVIVFYSVVASFFINNYFIISKKKKIKSLLFIVLILCLILNKIMQ